ncbi:double-stranded RNA binding motif domain-containing protein, partial [Streptomyces sp. NPDC006265]|uniref:double-stranded RNA binding motif domain-containing protein n=1 Tax=Streptomyces sp. NPDC006265 TaxID=3156740 RepID=UPI0033B77560
MSIDRLQPISPAALATRNPRPEIPASRAETAEGPPLSLMDAETFRSTLQRTVAQGAPAAAIAAESVHRIARGHLDVAALRTALLDTAEAQDWAPVRQAAILAVAASPALAPSIISMHAQMLRTPAATVREGQGDDGLPFFVAQATFAPTGRDVTGSVQQARTRKAARQQAMAALIAALAGLPDPLADRAVQNWSWDTPAVPLRTAAPAGESNAVSVLNEFHQAGHITRPDYRPPTPSPTGFAATVTAVHRGQQLIGEGTGSSKRQARAEAADRLLKALEKALGADEPQPQPAPEPATTPLPPAAPAPPALNQEPPPALTAGPGDLFAAHRAIEQALAGGAALTLLPSRHPARASWMLFQPDGTHPQLLDSVTAPLQPVTRDLVLAGAGGIMPRRATVTGVAVPVGLALTALLTPREGEHASVTGWRPCLRLAVACVAQQRVYPALTADGQGCWRIGPITEPLRTAVTAAAALMAPEGHCLLAGTNPIRVPSPEHAAWPLLDAVADTLLRTPAAATLLGSGPHTGPAGQGQDADPTPELWRWADAIEDGVDPHSSPRLVLRIKDPDANGPVPAAPAVLHLAAGGQDETVAAITVWDGQRNHADLTPAVLPGVGGARGPPPPPPPPPGP